MDTPNPTNERIKMEYADFLDRDEGLAERTVDQKLDAIYHYEQATNFADFKTFNRDKAIAFVEAMEARDVTNATRLACINHVKAFFKQMAMDGLINGKASRRAISALRLSRKDQRAGRAQKPKKFATVAEFKQIIAAMPRETAIERRNRALVAFTLLSGARDGAIISMRLKHVDFARREVMQYPDEVDTKNSKLIATWFFPVGEGITDEVKDYVTYLRDELGFTSDDPLFPKTLNGHDENDRFTPIGLTKARWATAQPVRDIFKRAFMAQGFTYRSPHRIRNTMMAFAYDLGLNGKELKAWSQNLGHEKLETSVNCYGNLGHDEQRRTMLAIDPDAINAASENSVDDRLSRIEAILLAQTNKPSA